MKISYNWLKEYISIDVSPEEAAETLTATGLEVEGMERQAEKFDNIVIGKVLTCEKHPNADKLSVCTVTDGEREYPVICGAPNVAAGQVVFFARPGAVIPDGGFKIERRKIRGIVSEGMICSYKELGINDDHSGIAVLEDDVPVGSSAAEYLGQTDTVLEIGITPNRMDALSHVGVARDLAAVYRTSLTIPDISGVPDTLATEAQVVIEDPDLCPRYCAGIIKGITVKQSPEWLQRRLLAAGMRPLNNIVDITNFVMLEIGQPMHAFDLAEIHGREIHVRRAGTEQKFITLDEKERVIRAETLLICDAERPLAIAGVMGGENSEISDSTTAILLESAYFNPSSIRRTSKYLGLSTESSYRFERGADPNMVDWALKRAVGMILELAGGEYLGMIDEYPVEITPWDIDLRLWRVERILGIAIAEDEIRGILERLGIMVDNDGGILKCTIPTFKADVTREIDVIEEIARIHGYDNIPAKEGGEARYTGFFDETAFQNKLRRFLTGAGFDETIAVSLVTKKHATMFSDNAVRLLNPVNAERPYLRPTLAISMLETIATNVHNGISGLRIFEIGHVFDHSQDKERGTFVRGYLEFERLGIAMYGEVASRTWYAKERAHDFFDIKGTLTTLLKFLHLDNVARIHYCKGDPLTDYRFSVEIKDKTAGYIAQFGKTVLESFDLDQPVYYLELDMSVLEGAVEAGARSYIPVSKYPAVLRDVAFIFNEDQLAGEVVEAIYQMNEPLIRNIRVLDVFQHQTLGKGKKSIAFSLVLQADDHTLNDDEITRVMERVISNVTGSFSAAIRG
ncbi:MAG: phenylalanine--tRNA ligase subunit beta [Chlorobi bacterium]|nr:phenylalanine--tRNA ligase subunit beta [Chlorobiota bacterium]